MRFAIVILAVGLYVSSSNAVRDSRWDFVFPSDLNSYKNANSNSPQESRINQYQMAVDEPLRVVTNSIGQFSTDLYKKIASEKRGKNLLISPLSAHVVLSMALQGAGGNTAKQILDHLYLPNKEVASKGFHSLIQQLNNIENVTLEIANKVCVADHLKLKDSYNRLMIDNFFSETSVIDTLKPAQSAWYINKWVDERTHHKIDKIINADDITSYTKMILLNAIYFKGSWAKKFDKRYTTDMNFNFDERRHVKAATMFVQGRFVNGYIPELQAQFIELPYENKGMKMVIIVPQNINGLSYIEENLEHLQKFLNDRGQESLIQLSMPKFKIENTIDLYEPLFKLQMIEMFSNIADFSGVANDLLKVDKVIQKTYIEVNEEGSEAASATGLVATTYSVPPQIHVNRPSLFMIMKGNVNVFIGRIADPSSRP